MVKLTTPDDRTAAFYFKDMKACETFINVFKNHWCNVVWNKPEEQDGTFPEAKTEYWLAHINDDPKELADKNLMWGFCIDKRLDRGLTPTQRSFVSGFIDQITWGDGCNYD